MAKKGYEIKPLDESEYTDTEVNEFSSGDDIPDEVISLDNGIEVACRTGSIRILRLLPEGKSRMSAEDFIRGRKINVGDTFA